MKEETNRPILQRHKETFKFPDYPPVSSKCKKLILSLIRDKEDRLCSARYRFKDLCSKSASPASTPTSSPSALGSGGLIKGLNVNSNQRIPTDFAGRYVFPYDAEDIKSHKWFKGVPWEHLHQLEPPLVPHIRSMTDTSYFDEVRNISDWIDSAESEASELEVMPIITSAVTPSRMELGPCLESPAPRLQSGNPLRIAAANLDQAKVSAKERALRVVEEALTGFPPDVQLWARAAVNTPYNSTRLHALDKHIDSLMVLSSSQHSVLKQFIRAFGKREKKPPRDDLLRNRKTRAVVLDLRKKTAFLGYSWRRMRPPAPIRIGPDDRTDRNVAGRAMFGGGDGAFDSAWEGGLDKGYYGVNRGYVKAIRGRLHRW